MLGVCVGQVHWKQ